MSCNGQFIVRAKQLKPPEKKKEILETLIAFSWESRGVLHQKKLDIPRIYTIRLPLKVWRCENLFQRERSWDKLSRN